jgi:hypothetical protein
VGGVDSFCTARGCAKKPLRRIHKSLIERFVKSSDEHAQIIISVRRETYALLSTRGSGLRVTLPLEPTASSSIVKRKLVTKWRRGVSRASLILSDKRLTTRQPATDHRPIGRLRYREGTLKVL